MRLEPMRAWEGRDFLPEASADAVLQTYGVVGGMPAYLRLFRRREFWDVLRTQAFSPTGFLYDEPRFLLRKMILSKTKEERDKALRKLFRFVKSDVKATLAVMDGLPHRTFLLERNGGSGSEIQWLINGLQFDPVASLADVRQGSGEVWTIANGGGGWVHPLHIHMEEHRVLSRTGGLHPDDNSKEDVVALGPGESVTVYRKFRTFLGPYVCHCHNLAHEDHAMMFGWSIVP